MILVRGREAVALSRSRTLPLLATRGAPRGVGLHGRVLSARGGGAKGAQREECNERGECARERERARGLFVEVMNE
jgi:hypothetical protein